MSGQQKLTTESPTVPMGMAYNAMTMCPCGLCRTNTSKNAACNYWYTFQVARSISNGKYNIKQDHHLGLRDICPFWTSRTASLGQWSTAFSEELEAYVHKNGIKHIWSSPYHPTTNGAAECQNVWCRLSSQHWKLDVNKVLHWNMFWQHSCLAIGQLHKPLMVHHQHTFHGLQPLHQAGLNQAGHWQVGERAILSEGSTWHTQSWEMVFHWWGCVGP